MKQTILVISLFAIIVFGYGCGSEPEQTTETADSLHTNNIMYVPLPMLDSFNGPEGFYDSTRLSNKQLDTLTKIISRQENCPGNGTPPDCSIDKQYCTDPGCIEKIRGCHEISPTEFTSVVPNPAEEGVIPVNILDGIRTSSDCYDFIKIEFHGNVYAFQPVIKANLPTSTNPTTYETYYSMALLKAIFEPAVPSAVYIYRGSNTQGKNFIPFKIVYPGGVVKFYDVSNDLP